MTGLERITAIRRHSLLKGENWVHKEIFRLLRKEDLWTIAYDRISNKLGRPSLNLMPVKLKSHVIKKLGVLRELVINEHYSPKQKKSLAVRESIKVGRTLQFQVFEDFVVQEVVRMVLEAIYEPLFSLASFGCYSHSHLGPHHALEQVSKTFGICDFVIEGRIESVYHLMDNKLLLSLLKRRIDDVRFLNLIWKILKAGLLSENVSISSITSVPYGSILLPILIDVYFREFDLWIGKCKINLVNGNPIPWVLQFFENIEEFVELDVDSMSSFDEFILQGKSRYSQMVFGDFSVFSEKIVSIEYIRYANQWLIGIKGHSSSMFRFKEEIQRFLKYYLRIDSSYVTVSLRNFYSGQIYFLGYEIFLPRNQSLTFKNKINCYRRNKLRFEAPIKRLLNELLTLGIIKSTLEGLRPISKVSAVRLKDHTIIRYFRLLWMGIFTYYSGCTAPERLQYVHYLIHMSCAMTLAHRHKTTSFKIFRSKGKTFTSLIPGTDYVVSFPYTNSWSRDNIHWSLDSTILDPFNLIRY